MKKKQTFVIAFVILIVASLVYAIISKNSADSEESISGTVVNVIDRENIAENGYYGMTVKTQDGKEYTIDATGYLNTPLTPERNNETCVKIPKVQLGNKVSFNLPANDSQQTDFEICHDPKISGYYFTLQT